MTVIAEPSARAATGLMFFLAGWCYAAWATRIPAIKDELDLSDGQLGLAILGLEAGAIVGLPSGGALVARAGSRLALRIGFVIFPVALVAVAFAPGIVALAGCLALMAAANSVVDVAVNAQGVELEHRCGRSILSGLHAGHPLGLVAGGLAGAAATAAELPVATHFAIAALIAGLASLVACHWLVADPGQRSQPVFARPSRRLLLLGLIAFCAFLLDGAAYNWTAVHLAGERGAPEWLAATAFTLFAITLAVGRLFGDRLVTRFGRVRVIQGCGVVAAAGSLLAILAPTTSATLIGWAVFGLGLAPLAPTVIGAARGVSRAAPGVAIAAVTMIGYLGSFTGPPVIGALAEVSSLSAALGLLVIISAVTVVLARPGLSQKGGQGTVR
ncbi:MFS transporter [Microlunatus parietis]|uniref:MFS family permease n=1 Tax=Microlunatus parietis TaxID=682979 RepID=A0A7Y9I3R4_9ACTN|nr:MFS transporter [Microlunatus parietis]NYE69682.1 MFS family permease [Microlunatus parietis]